MNFEPHPTSSRWLGLKSLAAVLVLGLTGLIAGCGGGGGGGSAPASPTLQSISVSATATTLVAGLTDQFTATGVYSDGSKQTLSSVTWASTSNGVASINSSGLATGVSAGTTTVTATSGGVTGQLDLSVSAPVLESITMTPASISVAKGLTQQFKATGNYNNNLQKDLTSLVTWSSDSPANATINSAGLATAVSQGTTTIMATFDGKSGPATLQVTNPVLESIAVTPVNPSIAKGTTQQFAATGTYSDGSMQTITTAATWTSSNTTYATVNASTGLAKGVAQGAAIIKATLSGVTGSTVLTVNAAALASIAVTPANATVIQGGTVQFTATGTYTDGSNQNVTVASTWGSKNTSVATITNAGGSNGLATGVYGGTTSAGETAGIMATIGNIISPTVTLTVKPAEYAYVANFSSDSVSQYTINPTTGALIANSPATVGAGTEPFAIAVDPTQSYVYVLNYGSNNLSEYAIGADGTLSSLSPATVNTGTNPNGLAVTSSNVYVANFGSGTLSQYGISAGVLSPLTPATVTIGAGTEPAAIAVNPAGTYAVVANFGNGTIMSFSIGAGGVLSTTPVSTITLTGTHQPDSVAFDPSGTYVYVGDYYNNAVWQYQLGAGGALTALSTPDVSAGGNPKSLAFLSTVAGDFLYVVNSANPPDSVWQFTEGNDGLLSSSATSETSVGSGTIPNFIAADPSGKFAYVTDRGMSPSFGTTVSQYSITPTGGATPGALTPLSPATATAGTQPTGIATAY